MLDTEKVGVCGRKARVNYDFSLVSHQNREEKTQNERTASTISRGDSSSANTRQISRTTRENNRCRQRGEPHHLRQSVSPAFSTLPVIVSTLPVIAWENFRGGRRSIDGLWIAAAVGIKSTPTSVIPTDDDPAEIDLASLGVPATIPRQITNTTNSPFAGLQGMQGMGMDGPGMGGMGAFSAFGAMGGAGGGIDGGIGNDMFSQLLAQMSNNPSSPLDPSANPLAPPPAKIVPKTTLDKIFPLLHFLSMIALGVWAVWFAEPSGRVGLLEVKGAGVSWAGWAALGRRSPVLGRVEGVVKSAFGASEGLANVVRSRPFIAWPIRGGGERLMISVE